MQLGRGVVVRRNTGKVREKGAASLRALAVGDHILVELLDSLVYFGQIADFICMRFTSVVFAHAHRTLALTV